MGGNYVVLFGDIVNFSQFLDRNENEIEDIISRHRTIIHNLVDKYDGELLVLFTDSSRIIFKNPLNAVQYCCELFRKFSHDPHIPYRASLSYGKVDFNKEGIYGKPATTASRLLSNCSEDAAILTSEVAERIKGSKIKIQRIGSVFLKGAKEPTEIHCIAEAGFYIPAQAELIEKVKLVKSIAVLPFQNTSSDQELDYICDGLAEEVIDSLTKSRELLVTARTSSFLFRNRDLPILEISRKLNVAFVLDGSIRKRNQEYRISYQLVDASTGYNVLSDTITSNFNSLYDSEKNISRDILAYFNIDKREEVKAKDYYLDPVAYDYYLKGKHMAFLWTADTSEEAIQNYQRALEIVPDYALAFAGLSICYTHGAINNFGNPKEYFDKALFYADKAIEADDQIYEGYLSKALATFWAEDLYIPAFEENLNRAMEISPSNAEIRMFHGMVHIFKSDFTEAIIELKLAQILDPYSVPVKIRLGLAYYLNKEYENSYNTFLSILNVDYHHAYTSIRLAWCCIQLKQYERALKHLNEAKKDHPYYHLIESAYLVAYHCLDDKDAFFQCKSRIENLDPLDVSYNFNQAVLQKLLNKPERAIHFLDKTLDDKMMRFAFVHFDVFWEEYFDLPDFQELMAKTYRNYDKKTVQLKSDTKESLEICISDFIYAEAQDNYTLIVLKKDKEAKNKILRASLSSIEKQLADEEVIRCHRSYLINKNAGFHISRDSSKICLKLDELDFQIPVSRSKEKEIKVLFRN